MPTALIVEDEPAANELLSMLIRLRGYSTDSAFTGTEALEYLRHHRPDIVFLDLMLPDMNGYEICKSLKTCKETSLIPLVMVTARVADENRAASFGLGADDYIPKPYVPDQIFQALSDASSWNVWVCGQTIDGCIAIDPTGEQETLRRLGQLQNLLVARTSLDHPSIERLVRALRQICHDGVCWALRAHRPLNAALDFRIEPDRLAITLRDFSGWLADNHYTPKEPWGQTFTAAGFDEVSVEDSGRQIRCLKRFVPAAPPLPA